MNISFPDSFVFGVADADLQVIGEKHTIEKEGSMPTMWRHFANEEGRVFKKHSTDDGVERYYNWKKDVQIIKNLGVRHYRTSISMARTLTEDKKVNEKAIKWYKDYFEELKRNNITIYATLYHWELPQHLSEIGGWKNKKSIEYLIEHAKVVYKYLNEYIEEYFILNEPWCSTFFSYHTGDHAPGEKDLSGALQAAHNILLAQGLVYKELRGLDKKIKLSTVYNPVSAYTTSPTGQNVKARDFAFGYYTGWLMDPLYKGSYPVYMMEVFGDHMPNIEKGDMETMKIGDKLHSFGVNYYYSALVEYDPKRDVRFRDIVLPGSEFNGLKWPTFKPPTYPEGFYDTLTTLYNRYSVDGMNKLYITENGTCWPSEPDLEGKVDDDFRIGYLREHISQVHKALRAGVPIEAYFAWTLMDNYEWQFGYKPDSCFGLVHVDRKSFNRTPKSSYYWYKSLAESHQL